MMGRKKLRVQVFELQQLSDGIIISASIVKDACNVIGHWTREWINLLARRASSSASGESVPDQQEVTVCKVACHRVWGQFNGCLA